MAIGKRVTPYKQKAKRSKKKDEAIVDLDERVTQLEMEQAGVDTELLKNRMELMTAEQLAETQQVAAQNALKLFNEMLAEVRRRIPTMEDERIVNALLAIWDKTGGKK